MILELSKYRKMSEKQKIPTKNSKNQNETVKKKPKNI